MRASKLMAVLVGIIFLSGCQTLQDRPNETVGTVLGAAAGAVIGSQFGGGDGRTVAVAIGTLAGAYFGKSVGQSLDRADRIMMEDTTQSALETAPIGQTSNWSNPDSGNSGTVTPTQTWQASDSNQPCREYSSTVTIDGQLETITGTACRRPDGTWRSVD